MSKLSSSQRKSLPKSSFAIPSKAPGSGSYPMPDRAHAANAKARVAQYGTAAEKARVNAKANKILGKKR